jgi:hypothetical protein
MSRWKKGQEYNSYACLNEIERSFQTLLNAKNQRKENSIEAALHPIIVVKSARVRARAEVSCGHYIAIPMVCGGRNCIHYPHVLSSVVGSTNNRGIEDDISR